MGLAAQDHIGVSGVDIDQDGSDIGKLRSQCAAKLLCVGQLCPGADQTDHDLAAVDTPAQKHMTNQPFARLLIVGLDVVGGKEIAEVLPISFSTSGCSLQSGQGTMRWVRPA